MKKNYFIAGTFFIIMNTCFATDTKMLFPTSVLISRGMSTSPHVIITEGQGEGEMNFGKLKLSGKTGGVVTMNPDSGNLSVETGSITIGENGSLGHFDVVGYGLTGETPIQISFNSGILKNGDKSIELQNIQSKELEINRGILILTPKTGVTQTKNSFSTAGTLIIPADITAGDYEGYYSISITY